MGGIYSDEICPESMGEERNKIFMFAMREVLPSWVMQTKLFLFYNLKFYLWAFTVGCDLRQHLTEQVKTKRPAIKSYTFHLKHPTGQTYF